MGKESLIRAMERLVRMPISPRHVVSQDIDLRPLRRYVKEVRRHHEAALRGGDGRKI